MNSTFVTFKVSLNIYSARTASKATVCNVFQLFFVEICFKPYVNAERCC